MDNKSLEKFLNIYSDEEFNIDNIAQNCQCVELNFTPYHLTHCELITWVDDQPIKEKVFILSGSDHKIHIFREAKENHNFKEIDCESPHFPEFYNPPAIVIWISVYYINDNVRISAFGCENGYLRLVKINARDNTIIFNQSTQYTSAISQITLYPSIRNIQKPPQVISEKDEEDLMQKTQFQLDLLVVNAILPVVIFTNVGENALTKYTCLKRKDTTSVSMCSTPADITCDGNNQIIVGNSLEEVMIYKVLNKNNTAKEDIEIKLGLVEIMNLVGPVLHLLHLDITGDGVKELIVFTTKGVYIYQHEYQWILEVLQEKIELLTIPNI